MTIYKDVLENQCNKCKNCGNEISGFPIFAYKGGVPVFAICLLCSMDREEKEINRQEKREKERADWLNKDHPHYEIRLRCHNEGHKVVGSSQGFVGGGCWCGYYSPEEKPLRYEEY